MQNLLLLQLKRPFMRMDNRDMNTQARADILFEIAAAIEKRYDKISLLEILNNGKPLRESKADANDAVYCFKYYVGLIIEPYGGIYDVHNGFEEMHLFAVYEPVGVCTLITPWNYPFLMATWKIAPALAAGNCIVLKPSSNTPLSSVIVVIT